MALRRWRRGLCVGLLALLVLLPMQGSAVARAPTQAGGPVSVILFVGDGMGEAHRTAARWASVGQAGALAMDAMPVSGWMHTAPLGYAITDSAASATAMASGVKTNNGRIGVDADGDAVQTILELAQARGMAVGLVTTTPIVHATPAAFAAHVLNRNQMVQIAEQMLERRVDVLLGGGEDYFLTGATTGCFPHAGVRRDGRDLIAEARAEGYAYVCDAASLAALDAPARVLGLFADTGMTRPFSPTLAAMTRAAIDVLSQDPEGFFLMVEGGQIDWAAHDNDAAHVIEDTLDFDAAVAVAQAYAAEASAARAGHTLIIVTADHETGGMAVALEPGGTPGEDGPFTMPDGTPFYATWSSDDHTATPVPVTAQGPWSGLLAGEYENTFIYEVMRLALRNAPVYLPVVLRVRWSRTAHPLY